MPANEVHFLLAHHFTLTHNTSCEHIALTSTMFSHWRSSLWWFLGLPSPFDAYVLVSWLRLKDQIIAYMGRRRGVEWLTTYFSLRPLIILPKRFFSSARVKDSLLVFLCQILLSDYWNFLYQTYNINVLILSFGPNIWGGAVTTSFVSFDNCIQITFSCVVNSRTVQNSCWKSRYFSQSNYL